MKYSILVQPGLSYEKALLLIKALKSSRIIKEANIVSGGISVYIGNNSELNMLMSICKNFGVVCSKEFTMREEDSQR